MSSSTFLMSWNWKDIVSRSTLLLPPKFKFPLHVWDLCHLSFRNHMFTCGAPLRCLKWPTIPSKAGFSPHLFPFKPGPHLTCSRAIVLVLFNHSCPNVHAKPSCHLMGNYPSKTVIQRGLIQVLLDVDTRGYWLKETADTRGYWLKETADTRAKTKVMLEQLTDGSTPMVVRYPGPTKKQLKKKEVSNSRTSCCQSC